MWRWRSKRRKETKTKSVDRRGRKRVAFKDRFGERRRRENVEKGRSEEEELRMKEQVKKERLRKKREWRISGRWQDGWGKILKETRTVGRKKI